MKGCDKPDLELFENWFDNEEYFKKVEYSRVGKFLRDWKSENSFNEREYVATVYAYAVRQLTYEGTDKEIAAKLIEKAIEVYR